MTPELNNKATFKKLYSDYFGILVNYAFSKCGDREVSREIVQNTFVKIWSKKDHLEIRTSIKSYLFSMVRNSLIDYFRYKDKITDLDSLKEMGSEDSDIRSSQEERAITIRYLLKKALNSMKPKRKMIFEMSKFEGLTYSEIAKHLSISERAVEDNIAKAIAQIREMLKDQKYDLLK